MTTREAPTIHSAAKKLAAQSSLLVEKLAVLVEVLVRLSARLKNMIRAAELGQELAPAVVEQISLQIQVLLREIAAMKGQLEIVNREIRELNDYFAQSYRN